jgi:hypothetical protein
VAAEGLVLAVSHSPILAVICGLWLTVAAYIHHVVCVRSHVAALEAGEARHA